MATLQDVRDRLERAVGRLEAAQKAYKSRYDAKLAQVQREALAAGAEAGASGGTGGSGGAGPDMDDLLRALEETQAHNQALVDEREALADQIDAVIGRLQAVLNGGEGQSGGQVGSGGR